VAEFDQRMGAGGADHAQQFHREFVRCVHDIHQGAVAHVYDGGILADAGAECLVLCANTLHMFAEDAGTASALPIIHIAEATAVEIRKAALSRVGLLGTRLTMEKDFFRRKLAESGIQALVPDEPERQEIDNAIFDELVRGIFRPEVKQRFIEIMQALAGRGAQGIVMGCTGKV
jgi:aspartate racemase